MGITTKEYHEGYQQGYKEAKEEFQNTMRKYQMIKQLVNQAEYAGENSYTGEAEWTLTDSVYQKIREILEDGNDD